MPINTEEFLQTTTDSALDDHLEPCPPGEWSAVAGAPEVADFVYKSGNREGEVGYRMVIRWEIQDQEVKDTCQRDTVSVMQSILLDLNDAGDGLDFGKGKNIGLGQIRSALGQNEAGAPWSPAMITGQVARVKIAADVYQDRVTAKVTGVTAA